MYRATTSLALLLLVVACSSGGGAGSPTAPGAPSVAQIEFDSFTLINGARTGNGIDPPLELREAVAAVARGHSRNMRQQGFFGHADPAGQTLVQRLADEGITYRVAAENLARVTNVENPAAWAHDQLMQSAEHRPNILNSDFQFVGVGVVTDGTTYWLTQVFIGL